MITVKIGRRGQITLPSAIRRQTGLVEGDRVALIPQGEKIILRPITQSLLELRGSVPVSSAQDFTAVRQQVIAHQAERIAGNES